MGIKGLGSALLTAGSQRPAVQCIAMKLQLLFCGSVAE